jgi:hypothetical protein
VKLTTFADSAERDALIVTMAVVVVVEKREREREREELTPRGEKIADFSLGRAS